MLKPFEIRTVDLVFKWSASLDRFVMIFFMTLFFIKLSMLVWIQFTLDQPITIPKPDKLFGFRMVGTKWPPKIF
jgi:hypothetical protein